MARGIRWTAVEANTDALDALAGSCYESGFMQSRAWADFKKSEGYEVESLGVWQGDQLIGGARLHQFGESRVILCPEGPVLDWQEPELVREAIRGLESHAQSRGAIVLRIEPHLGPSRPSVLKNWKSAPVNLTPKHTLMLDIARSEEAMLAGMHPKARYNIRVAERHGVEVSVHSSTAGVLAFHELFEETASRNGFFAEPLSFFLNLGSSGFPSGFAEVLLARWEGELLGGMVLVHFGNRSTYLYGGSTNHHRHVMPNYALHWTAIQRAKARGSREYDFYGYDPFGQADHLYAGISKFKNRWGAERRDWLGAIDRVFYDQLAEQIISQYGLVGS